VALVGECLGAQGEARHGDHRISSIHLLKTFINAAHYEDRVIIAQVAIHITFLISAMAIAASDRIMPHAIPEKLRNHP
jgi:uncharacterized membrane protein YqhA